MRKIWQKVFAETRDVLRSARRMRTIVPVLFAMIFSPLSGLAPHAERTALPDFIVTVAPIYKPLAEFAGSERFPEGAQLMFVHEGKAEPLTAGFAATADANVSFDGEQVLFAGKKAASDPWQIWEMTLADRSVRQVLTTATDAERPFYLPGGRMVWAQRISNKFQINSGEDGHTPTSTAMNPTAGPGVLPLTYLETSAFPVDVLADGRILFEAGFPLGSGSVPELFVTYADGSGVEAYRCDHGHARWGGTQLSSGDVVFTHGTSLARFTSAMAHEVPVQSPHGTYAGAIAETASGAWLMSARATADTRYAIEIWKPGSAAMHTVLAMRGRDIVEPVMVAARTRPNRHPSGLHPWEYANMLALDARISRDGTLKSTPATVRLEMQNTSGEAIAVGTAPVEQDGSFFVKVPADRPIRFALFDSKGAVLRQEHGWFWVRRGEQRYCTGCHAGPEHASENRVPAVLMRTTEPVDLTGSDSKLHASTGGK